MEKAFAIFRQSSLTTHPRPCHPICITFPSSTSTGTVRWPPASAFIRLNASRSDSTSYSTNSSPLHSSHSRISSVCGQPIDPKSSNLGMAEHLQGLSNYVINGGLNFLNTRDVVRMNDNRKIGQMSALNVAAVVTEQCNCKQAALASFFERHHHVLGSTAGRDRHRHILSPGVSNELPKKNHFNAYVVGNRRDIGRLKGKRNSRHWTVARRRQNAVERPIVRVGG